MAKKLEVTAGYDFDSGLHDTETGKDCVTEKVVDVTEDCTGAHGIKRCVFLYTRTKRGRIVQISYFRKYELGTRLSFFFDELKQGGRVARYRRVIFAILASELGLSTSVLRSLIEAHAPND